MSLPEDTGVTLSSRLLDVWIAPSTIDGWHVAWRLLDRPVDLVMAGAVTNRYLEAAIDAERQLVYAA